MIDPELLAHATPEELAAYEAALTAELALSSPADYAVEVSPHVPSPAGTFQRARHIDMLNQAIADLVEGRLGTRRLIVTMPPRHGKSHLISTYTPAWYLTKYPNRKVAVTGYGDDFASQWGTEVRHILTHAPAGLAPDLDKATTAASNWRTSSGGGMFTVGAGGPLTGKGANLLIVDDPFKNHEEAQSPTIRDKVYNWFRSTAMTRLQNPSAVIVVHTRWHEDDLIGRLLKEEPERWHVINLPAIAGENDAIGRAPGEALWPEMFPLDDPTGLLETLSSHRDGMHPMMFGALYQQTPFTEGGDIYRTGKARFFTPVGFGKDAAYRLEDGQGGTRDVLTAQVGTFGIVDLAASTKTSADFSVFGLFGVTPDKDLLLLEAFRARIEGADHMATLDRLHQLWGPRFWGIERVTYGLTLLQTAARTGRIPVRELKADTDKVSRAYAAGALLESGRLYFPKGASWLADWLHELEAFPNGTHDDCADVTAYAAKVLSDRLTAPRRRKDRDEPVTWDEKVNAMLKRRRNVGKGHPTLGAGF